MGFTFCTSGAIVRRAGANVNSAAASSGALIDELITDAEGYVNLVTRYDWVTNSAAILTEFLPALTIATKNLAAADLIGYDMGAVGRGEAESRINVLTDRAYKAIKFLNLEENKTKMGITDQ